MHTSHQTTNSSQTTKSVLTQTYIKHTQTSNTFFFRRISPFGIAPVKKQKQKQKTLRLGYAGIVDHSVDLSIPDLRKKV